MAASHVSEELLKLHGIDFHNNLLVTEMSKSPLEQSNHYSQPPLQPHSIQRKYIAVETESPSEKILRYLQIAYQIARERKT